MASCRIQKECCAERHWQRTWQAIRESSNHDLHEHTFCGSKSSISSALQTPVRKAWRAESVSRITSKLSETFRALSRHFSQIGERLNQALCALRPPEVSNVHSRLFMLWHALVATGVWLATVARLGIFGSITKTMRAALSVLNPGRGLQSSTVAWLGKRKGQEHDVGGFLETSASLRNGFNEPC